MLDANLADVVGASMPSGRWRRTNRDIARGAAVSVRVVDVMDRAVLEQVYGNLWRRHCGDAPISEMLMLKSVAAVGGDVVVAADSQILINGLPVAKRYPRIKQKAGTPRWEGKRVLRPDEVFLLSKPQQDFPEWDCCDGRYLGPIAAKHVIAVWELVVEEN